MFRDFPNKFGTPFPGLTSIRVCGLELFERRSRAEASFGVRSEVKQTQSDGVRNLFRRFPNKFGTPFPGLTSVRVCGLELFERRSRAEASLGVHSEVKQTQSEECETCFATSRTSSGLRSPGLLSIKVCRIDFFGLLLPLWRTGKSDPNWRSAKLVSPPPDPPFGESGRL